MLTKQVYAEFRTIYLKVEFSLIFADTGQRHIQRHLPRQISKTKVFAKILKAVNYFCKSSISDIGLGSKYASGWLCIRCSTNTLRKNQIFVDLLLIEVYEYAALRQELFIVPFVEVLTTTKAALINFVRIFIERKLSIASYTKGAVHCFFCRVL